METQKTPEDLANELTELIQATSTAFQRLLGSGIAQRTLLILIREACPTVQRGYSKAKPTLSEIEAVLTGAKNLARIHLKQPVAKKAEPQ